MKDWIEGKILNVIDGDTFLLQVEKEGNKNMYSYNKTEKIRIAYLNAPELGTWSGWLAKIRLSWKLRGKKVKCWVDARDKYKRIVASYEIKR